MVYSVDVSNDIIILALPNANAISSNSFTFEYYISGTEYNWWEKLIIGPNGTKYYIIALACAGAVGAAILLGIILGIVYCCKKRRNKA